MTQRHDGVGQEDFHLPLLQGTAQVLQKGLGGGIHLGETRGIFCGSKNWDVPLKLGMMKKIHIPDLVNIPKTMDRSTIFHGKTHYFYGHVQ
jgi:hypothetical protein